ncbi:MAG: serine/threonine-protein kinase, partial [Actinomycetota bacterium]|nr:serine/threonine-protein kinase [Actinomycetota bacterium]
AMSSAALVSHPNLVAVFDWGVHERSDGAPSTAYVVTERLEGGSLRDIFDRGRRLSYSQALQVGLDLCHGLAEAHRQGHIHGEVTPSKIVFGADGRARLVDLGLAAPLQAAMWSTSGGPDNNMVLYTAPEVAEGQPATARTDVYGLGLVLVEALTGNVPFSTDSAAATLRARVGRILPVTADLGPLGRVLEQAARPEVDQRASAVELGMEFVNVARRLPRPEPLPLVLSIDPGAATAPPQEPEEAVEPEPTPQTDPSPDGAPPHSVGLPQPVDEMPSEPSSGEPILAAHDGFSDAGFEAYQGVVSPEEPVTRRPRWVSPVVAVVVVAVGVLGARAFLTTPVHEVPVLTGIAEAEAANIVTPFEWEVTVVSERSD